MYLKIKHQRKQNNKYDQICLGNDSNHIYMKICKSHCPIEYFIFIMVKNT